ncbi:GH3 auxin-responsive promoter family protein [Lutimaribacter marinistellae]|uniref:GH3 auxin-responsive promoter family protein n=1 Tax=Lutimaribacter marinistellae TaxID=1820329 RepID=A0ABV7TGT6_9RHOB
MTGRSYHDFTTFARAYAWFRTRRLDATRPEIAQAATLRRLVRHAVQTVFGRAHRFSAIDGIEPYQRQVPIRDYETFWETWWQPDYPKLVDVCWPGKIPFFTMTSGTTTGRSKYIPYTFEMRRAAIRGLVDPLCFHLIRRPDSRLFGGAVLGLTGPVKLSPVSDGADAAAVSAVTAAALPGWLRHRVLPAGELANLEDWQEKIQRLAPLSLTSDVRMLAGSPNWLLIFLAEVARQGCTGTSRLADWYPDLELIVHGGVNFTPYRDRFRALLEGSHAETREMYSASEGVFAYADRVDGDGLRLNLDGRIFYEFVPPEQLDDANPDRRWIGNVDIGVDYALIITTAAGLWSYAVGDIVRFVDLWPPRLIVSGRVQQGLSVFGEHLLEIELAEAVAHAARAVNLTALDYTVGSLQGSAGGHHAFLVEPDKQVADNVAGRMAEAIDSRLCDLNKDYHELRKDGALGAPEVRLVPPGGFARWMRLRRNLGGQNKLPRIVIDPDLFADIRNIALKDKGRSE